MATSDEQAARFYELFRGLDRSHGRYHIHRNGSSDKGKVDGHGVTVHEPVTVQLWQAHLDGNLHLGVVPLREDGTTTWGAIDVDDYGLDLPRLATRLDAMVLPLIPVRTKSGGVHLYLFLAQPEQAKLLRQKLSEFARALGWPTAEVFPKQDLVDEGGSGNWINMPYQGGTYGLRYALDANGNALEADEFLAIAANRAVLPGMLAELDPAAEVGESAPPEDTDKTQQTNPHDEFLALPHGPPCLNDIIAEGGVDAGVRNEFLWNVATYHRKAGAKPSDLEAKMMEHNTQHVHPPMDHRSLTTTIKSALKKPYNYRCNQQPLAAHCQKALCRMRAFGVAAKAGPDVMLADNRIVKFGTLIKYESSGDDPKWMWDVDGTRLELKTDELLNQRLFIKKYLEKTTNRLIRPMAAANWTAIVAAATARATTSFVPDDASTRGRIWIALEKYCTRGTMGRGMEDLHRDLPFTEKGVTYFSAGAFINFLHTRENLHVSASDVYIWLHNRGLKRYSAVIKGLATSYWSIPSFTTRDEDFQVPRDPDLESDM